MKKRVLFISLLLCVCVFIGFNVVQNNKYITDRNLYTNNQSKTKVTYSSMEEIHTSSDNVITDLKNGKYENLFADNLHVTLADEDSVSKITIHSRNDYRGITDARELMEEQIKVIKYFLGEDLDMQYLVDAACWSDAENRLTRCLNYNEVLALMNAGTYQPMEPYTKPYMSYVAWTKGAKNDTRYAHVSHDFSEIVFIKGKLMELQGSKWENPEERYKAIATYYMDDINLEDEYKLLNGTISIRDAIDYVEKYFNGNQLPYDKAPEVEEKVAKVEVFEIAKDTLCLEFTLRRKYKGLVFEYGPLSGTYMGAIPPYENDHTRVIMVETDEIDERLGMGNGMIMEQEGEAVTQVVSLESAIQKVSRQIGKNSKYRVDSIEMIYRNELVHNDGFYNVYKGTPCWMFQCVNQADNKMTTFYIELISGSINYYTTTAVSNFDTGTTSGSETDTNANADTDANAAVTNSDVSTRELMSRESLEALKEDLQQELERQQMLCAEGVMESFSELWIQ